MPDEYDISAGDMRFRLEVQANTPAPGAKGQKVDVWETLATRWGNVLPAGQFFTASEQIRNSVSHKVVMRYFEGLTPRHRIKHKGRIFNILSVLNEGERNVRHTVLVTEVV